MPNDVEHLLCAYLPFIYPFGIMLFAHFLIELFGFYSGVLVSSLCILDISPLLDIWYAGISSNL